MTRSTLKIPLNTNSEEAWPLFREALLRLGCDEASALSVWEQVKSTNWGEVDPRTGKKPGRSYFDLQRAMNAELGPPFRSPEDDLAVVWRHAERFTPGNVLVTIHNKPTDA
jgi:hypothetical protein